MSDADRVAAFLKLAQEDPEAARLLKFSVPRQAAFFVQQAAEKIGKSLLIREDVDPARIHAIGKLAAELPEAHPLKSELMALDRLSVYATATRYPSPTGKLPPAPDLAVYDDDDRWPRWASVLFVATSSLVLWALIAAGLWWLILSD